MSGGLGWQTACELPVPRRAARRKGTHDPRTVGARRGHAEGRKAFGQVEHPAIRWRTENDGATVASRIEFEGTEGNRDLMHSLGKKHARAVAAENR